MQENTQFGSLVRDVSKLIRKRFERKASAVGLTQSQWLVISELMEGEGINQSMLAEKLHIEPITLVGLLDRLEESGWVERKRDPKDRRAWLIYLTRRVNPIIEKMESIRTQVGKEAFTGVSTQEKRQMMQLLERVRSNLATRGEFF